MSCGYIFDFDGVLANNMELHYQCNRQALAEAGVEMDKAQYFSQAGMTGIEQIAYFCTKAGVKADYQHIYARKKVLFTDYIDQIAPIQSNIDLLNLLQSNGVPVAIATGSSRNSLLPAMKKLGLEVEVLVTSEDVSRGKPHPDLFLLAAERLGLEPTACIVVEDSDVGIEAAKAARMRSLRFYNNGREDAPWQHR